MSSTHDPIRHARESASERWQTVPKYPTAAMKAAGRHAAYGKSQDCAHEVYAKMLAVAPSPPAALADPTPAPIYQDDGFIQLPVSQKHFDGIMAQLAGLLRFINELPVRLDAPTEIHMDSSPGHSVFLDWIAERHRQTPAPSGDDVAELRAKLRSAEATIAKAMDRETQAEARATAAEARCKTMEEVLTKIRDMDWVENCLDPQWPASMARTALSQHQKGEGHDGG